jgi:archaeosine-15-forming tRNA-guanine transglycosylase
VLLLLSQRHEVEAERALIDFIAGVEVFARWLIHFECQLAAMDECLSVLGADKSRCGGTAKINVRSNS